MPKIGIFGSNLRQDKAGSCPSRRNGHTSQTEVVPKSITAVVGLF
jgi:hypothetical protein